jgi:hypothetical protein
VYGFSAHTHNNKQTEIKTTSTRITAERPRVPVLLSAISQTKTLTFFSNLFTNVQSDRTPPPLRNRLQGISRLHHRKT